MKIFLVLTKNIEEYKQSVNLLTFSKNVTYFFLKAHAKDIGYLHFLNNEYCILSIFRLASLVSGA